METSTLNNYRQIIETVLSEYAGIPYAYGDISTETVFDRNQDRYLLVNVGWEDDSRVHGCIVHIDIIDCKIWIQRDGTEEGIATDLESAGITKDQIILGFRPPQVRKYTGYAIA